MNAPWRQTGAQASLAFALGFEALTGCKLTRRRK